MKFKIGETILAYTFSDRQISWEQIPINFGIIKKKVVGIAYGKHPIILVTMKDDKRDGWEYKTRNTYKAEIDEQFNLPQLRFLYLEKYKLTDEACPQCRHF